ncbi:hypothetical protein [Cedecea colo]|uniref:Uncharacterized protein n=1 Tax=Cedecea colo TaxID=2552946 RepID=A0ABX0VHU5_9ENTR|nr:hypothetical protein [Cedecea colo]NIY46517.1 hypothetical protein [Cedecea colo]
MESIKQLQCQLFNVFYYQAVKIDICFPYGIFAPLWRVIFDYISVMVQLTNGAELSARPIK